MNVAIIKYNAGNIRSVDHALKRLGVSAMITDDPEKIMAADKVIFPGVGEAVTTMAYLKERGMDRLIAGLKQPVLGICLGQQLMCSWSEEGDTACIGIFDEPVRHFPVNDRKVPHMGWNSISGVKGGLFEPPLKGSVDDSMNGSSGDLLEGSMEDSLEGAYVYFVHSYYVPACEDTAAQCDYMLPFSAAMQKGNFYATQFHPEKSGEPGQQILSNFLQL